MPYKKYYINVYKDTFLWKDEKPVKGAIEHSYHTSRKGAISALFDRKYYYNNFSELKFSQPLKLKKNYLYSLELNENECKKLDLMKKAKKKEKFLIKKEISDILKNQQKMSKNVNSNIEKLLVILKNS